MQNIKITVASLCSELLDPSKNMERVRTACDVAVADAARLLFLPELMLTGHGGHAKMTENAEPVPDGPMSRAILDMSRDAGICISVGIAELTRDIVYNSQMVVDRGEYLGLQRKINMSSDEYLWFGVGESLELFDIGDVRFVNIICYDNHFAELALAAGLLDAELILAPHAARSGKWPDELTAEFKRERIRSLQEEWQKLHQTRARDHNVFVLLNNAVGSSVMGLDTLDGYDHFGPGGLDQRRAIANHSGTVMGFNPKGETILRTQVDDFVDEIRTVELHADQRQQNFGVTRNRRRDTMMRILDDATGG